MLFRSHRFTSKIARDRKRDAWLRNHGWLTFRIDSDSTAQAAAQLQRRWGGARNVTIIASVFIDGKDVPKRVEIELVRRPPGSKAMM